MAFGSSSRAFKAAPPGVITLQGFFRRSFFKEGEGE
jgi:hypothetical protein